MHGCSSGPALLVNAEVDSMGGVVDSGVGIGIKTSPHRAAIEKAQAELRQEYDVREGRRRELEFLEKGGNPLDFKYGNVASVSVQSTSLTDHPELFVTSEAKGSFALTASPHGDSIDSSGRPGGTTVCEPNTADNLLLFDGENEFIEAERNSGHPRRINIAPSEDGSQNAKESGDSAAFDIPKNRAYRRRNRSRPNRDGARSSSTNIVPSHGGLSARHGLEDSKGPVFDTNNQKNPSISSNCKTKISSPNGSMVLKAGPSNGQLDMELEDVRAVDSASGPTIDGPPEAASDVTASKNLLDNQHNQRPEDDVQETPICPASDEPKSAGIIEREQVMTGSLDCAPCAAIAKVEVQNVSGQLNDLSNAKGDVMKILNERQNSNVTLNMKGLDSESSCTQTAIGFDGNDESGMCTRNIVSNGTTKEPSSVFCGTPNVENDEMNETKVDVCAFVNDDQNTVQRSNLDNGSILKVEEELLESGSGLQSEVNNPVSVKGMEPECFSVYEAEREHSSLFGDSSNPQIESACTGRLQGHVDSSGQELHRLPVRHSTVAVAAALEQQTTSGVHFMPENRAHEDSILEEARIIEAKRKRIAELSVGTLSLENRRRSHWDFVLEEMAWLANDFAQERLWKITAAAQICHQVVFASRLRFEVQILQLKQKKVAHTLAKGITEFWLSAEETSKESELQYSGKKSALSVYGYAVRFLKYNSSSVQIGQAEAPVTPDRLSDLGIQETLWEDHLTEENLFYTVLPGAIESYRESIESHLAQCEKTSSNMQGEVETSIYDAVAGSQENGYDEDEGETSTYFLLGASEGIKSSKFAQKKWKNSMKSYAARAYEVGSDLAFMQRIENKGGAHQSVLVGKRPANSLNVGSIPTKRVRTASRQRVLSPFNTGMSGCVQAPNKTDASSGDTNSYQDDQSTLHGGSQIPNSLEVESVGDFERQLPFDSTEVSKKPKKRKKPKHLGSTHEQRWQLDSNFQNEQRDHSRKRLESSQLESNGNNGLFGQYVMKKPKMMKQSLDSSFDNLTPMAGSIPSPVASQMSNMSNHNKFIKMLGSRDRGRKTKGLKMTAGQPGSGSPWSLFEDQALVVLVHDMGPNWELISDAINSTLQFKCIFRKPKECKERHNILLDRTAGDGADSAEDSGSSQPYPSTLPGIPKGSARQLFQRLQGPMEEDTLKSHFEKIIVIGQKLHYRTQKDNQDMKQIQPHNSHVVALSQVCPNNLNGGPPLTPLDLGDSIALSPEAPGFQGSQTGGLAISNQGTVASVLSASGGNSSLQGSSSMVLGSSPSGPLNASIRDGRYGAARTASSSMDEQQRIQQYNQILSGRNIQQSSLPVPGSGTDRPVRMLPGGNSMNVMCGPNRGMPVARPGFQGIASPSMLNAGSMVSSNMVVMPATANMHSGAGTGQGNSMLRPRDALHMIRPTQNPEHQRQMMVPEIPMQVTQTNSQGVTGFVGSPFSNQTAAPPVQPYPLHHHHQQNQSSPQHPNVFSNHHPHLQGPNQAYIRIAKERHHQQRLLQQQQQQQHFAASNALVPPHAQAQPQLLPVSSSPQNLSQTQSQTSMQPVSMSPLTSSSSSMKHHMPPHGLGRNSQTGGVLTNQTGKQRQRPPQQQQSSRHHPQQRQQQSQQSHQQAKLLKGVGRGNTMMHQNLPIDPSLLNGLSATPGLYSGAGPNPVQPSKPLAPPLHTSNHSAPQQMYSAQATPSSKQFQQNAPSRSANGNHGHVPPVMSGPTLSVSHQSTPTSGMATPNHHQPPQKLVNQTQPAVQRLPQQNSQMGSDPSSKSQAGQVQADQQPVVNSSQMSTSTAMPREQIYDSGKPNSESSSAHFGNLTNKSGEMEPTPPINQGFGHRQLELPPTAPQQQQEQQLPQQQSQQPTQHLQGNVM